MDAVPFSAEVYETSRDSEHRLSLLGPVSASRSPRLGTTPRIELLPNATYQTIEGFGGAFTESSAYVLAKLSATERKRVLEAYFDPQKGIGYSLCRTHINSCDFSLGNWSCDDVAGDVSLSHFSMERPQRWILPLIHDALAVPGANFKLLASPWSPPAWMKTNGEMNNGGQLKPEYRDVWARFLARYLTELKKQSLPIWALTVQNEPAAVQKWDSCVYSAEEERDFVRDHLGPTLEKEGLGDIHIVVWDHNKDILWQRIDPILHDSAAARYVWGVGLHWYGGEHTDQMDQVHEAFPGKALLFTEGCWEGGARPWQWDRGERYAHNMIVDLNHWSTGWIDWNLALDFEGGPNHVGNFCDAPVLVNEKKRTFLFQTSYYYIGHFSKFIRPGAVRIGEKITAPQTATPIATDPSNSSAPTTSPALSAPETAAFRNPDGSFVLVALNTQERSLPYEVELQGYTLEFKLPPRGIQTIFIKGHQ